MFPDFETLGVGLLVANRHGLTRHVNGAAAHLLGRAPSELIDVSLYDLVSPPGREVVRSFLEACVRDGRGRADLPLIAKDGSFRWVIASAQLHAAAAADAPSLVCVLTDITARKEHEDSLRRVEGQYLALTEAAEDHIFVITRDDRVEFVNQAAARQLRTSPDHIIGRRRSEIFPPDVGERQAHGLRHVLESGKAFYAEGRTMYLDREVWLSTWLAPVHDREGGVRAVLGLSRDMTDAKRASDALRESEQRMRVVLSRVPVVLWAVDRQGIGTFCAGRGLEALGGTPQDVIGRAFNDITLTPFPALGDDLRRALAGESVNRLADLGPSTFETWTTPLRDERNDVVGATGVLVDVSERRRLEQELANAQKMEVIGHLAGGIAHDFNNNLTAILGYVELARGAVRDPAVTRSLDEARHAAERAAGLVRRLLAFGRRQMLQRRTLSLNAVVESLMPMLQRLIGESVEIRTTLGDGLPAIVADPVEIEQILMNLALNARDAMPRGGVLSIETAVVPAAARTPPGTPPRPHAVLTVRDTGTGMTADVKAHVFDPFFTTKPVDQGTGLGLSTVYAIVKQLEGFIDVESAVGVGSVFQVSVPAADGAADEAVTPPPAVVEAAARRATVLLVEDEDAVRAFARTALEHHGFAVIEAATPVAALSLVEGGHAFSLLLTDVVMPRITGPELARRVRDLRPGVKVLYMSGYPANLVKEEAVDPAMRVLPKPFTVAQLVAGINETLDA